jgi:hypothetical protein
VSGDGEYGSGLYTLVLLLCFFRDTILFFALERKRQKRAIWLCCIFLGGYLDHQSLFFFLDLRFHAAILQEKGVAAKLAA